MSAMRDMTLRNPEQLGRIVRIRRQEEGLSQAALAERLGVERKWVMHLEAGNAKADLGLVLEALDALGLSAHVHSHRQSEVSRPPAAPSSRLDEVFRRLKRPGRR